MPDVEREIYTELLSSDDPKVLWAISDSARGKELLLGLSWEGELLFSDNEAMMRFRNYVGK